MSLDLADDDFTLFGLEPRFAQDRAVIDARWRERQREAHPDRFAAQGAAAQRLAMQWSVRINEAYQRLRDPVRRAAYLCERHGVPVNAERHTAMPADFLMQQMAWREALEEATSAHAVQALAAELAAAREAALARLADELDARGDWPAAEQTVRELMFIERFDHDVQARIDALGQ